MYVRQNGIKAQIVPDFFQLTKNQMQVERLNGIPLITTRAVSIAGWNLFVKRALDVIAATVLLTFGVAAGGADRSCGPRQFAGVDLLFPDSRRAQRAHRSRSTNFAR